MVRVKEGDKKIDGTGRKKIVSNQFVRIRKRDKKKGFREEEREMYKRLREVERDT